MTNPLQGLPQPQFDLGSAAGSKQDPASPDFGDTLRNAMGLVGQLQSQADAQVAGMLTGSGQDVHSAMIAVEKANLAFELMVEVRNKIISAYQEVARMPF